MGENSQKNHEPSVLRDYFLDCTTCFTKICCDIYGKLSQRLCVFDIVNMFKVS